MTLSDFEHQIHCMSSVFCVRCVYCDKTAEVRIMLFSRIINLMLQTMPSTCSCYLVVNRIDVLGMYIIMFVAILGSLLKVCICHT